MESFLDSWGAALKHRVDVASYRDLDRVSFEGAKCVIFSDYDRLSDGYRVKMSALANQLIERGVRVLNHPQHSLYRAPLLDALYAAEINSFRAFLATQLPPANAAQPLRFPVFVRLANDHRGPGTSLLENAEALQRTLDDVKARKLPLHEMLIVEFSETKGPDGLYRKYSCFCVDGKILPRHMIASTRWALRIPDLVTPELIEEERVFLETNPHEQLVRRVFDIAKTSYGRIDYSVAGDRVEFWEINSNPYVMYPPEKYLPLQLPNQQWFAPRILQLFEALLA
jgi:hypothetical protein